jgi:hypothetical protein
LAANKQTAGFVCTTFNGVLPQVRKHRESLGPLEDHTGSEKAPSPLRFAGAVQKV